MPAMRSGISRPTCLLAVGAYALSGKGEDLQKKIQGWPEEKQASWKRYLSQGPFGLLTELGSAVPGAPDRHFATRVAVLRAMLLDAETRGGASLEPDVFTKLLKMRAVAPESLLAVTTSIPQGHPAAGEVFLAAGLALAELPDGREHAAELLARVVQHARGDAMINRAKAFQARGLMMVGGELDEVWEIAKGVRAERLSEKERDWFGTEERKWRRASGE